MALDQPEALKIEPPPLPVDVTPVVPPALAFGPKQAFAILGIYFGVQTVIGFVVGLVGAAVLTFQAAMRGGSLGSFHLPGGVLMVVVVLSSVMGAGGATAVSMIWRRGHLRSSEPAGFGFAWPRARALFVGVLAGLALGLAFRFLLPLLVPFDPHTKLGPVTSAALESPVARVLWVVFAIFLAPPIEEYLFRGVLLAGMRARFSTFASAATVTVLFVVGHVTEAIAYWPAFLALAAFGALTVGLRVWSGSILPGLAAHVAYNLVVAAAIVGF